MPDARKIFRSVKLAAILPVVGLAGCNVGQTQDPIQLITSHSFDSANWQQGAAAITTQVEPITVMHLMTFAPGESALSEQELASLRDFLQKSGGYDGARIEVDGPRAPGGYFDALTKARVEDIRAEISGLGLRSQIPAAPLTLLAKPPAGIAVTITRAMIIPPDCSAPQPDFATRPDYAWSCTSAANLGRMVVDPVDLVRGQTPGPADGEAAAKSIETYRKREIKDLKAEKTTAQ